MTKNYEGFPIAMFDRRVPSGKLTYLWKITIFNGIHYKSPFSIAMLIDRRVAPFFPQLPWLSAKVSEEPRLLRFPAPGSGWLRAAARGTAGGTAAGEGRSHGDLGMGWGCHGELSI